MRIYQTVFLLCIFVVTSFAGHSPGKDACNASNNLNGFYTSVQYDQSSKMLSIEFGEFEYDKYQFQLLDANDKVIYQSDVFATMNVSMANLSSGLYTLNLSKTENGGIEVRYINKIMHHK